MMEDNLQKPIDWVEEENNTLEFDYKETEKGQAIIKVVGVGGGGSNAVRHMYKEGIQDVSFLIINTDKQALKGSPIPHKLQIGPGLGAGAKPEKARQYAIDSEAEIEAALKDGTEMVFITAGMGGGTGTGAGPEVARIAHKLGILTVGIVTIPFEFEGRDKITMALDGVRTIKQHVDALLVVNNNRLIDIYPDFNFFNAFKKADDTLTVAAKSISDIINIEGYINLDFADVSTTLRDGGVALISTGLARGEGRVSKAIKEAVTSPLLQDNDISHSKHLLFELCFSESNPVTMSEIAELNDFVKNLNSDIKVIWGAMVDNSLGEDVKLIILASGFEMDYKGHIHSKKDTPAPPTETPVDEPKKDESAPEPQKKEKEEGDGLSEGPATATGPANDSAHEHIHIPVTTLEIGVETKKQEEKKPEEKKTEEKQPEDKVVEEKRPEVKQPEEKKTEEQTEATQQQIDDISKYYGEAVANKMRLDVARKAYYILDNEELSNEELIEQIEKLPAYTRSVEALTALKSRFRK